MSQSNYSLNKLSLNFIDINFESRYRDYILKRTQIYSRLAWGIVIFLNCIFFLLDQHVFGEKSSEVLLVRLSLIALSILVIASTYYSRFKKYQDFSGALLVLSIGIFCIYLIANTDINTFSPYFTGLFFAFTGIFTVAGLGFKFSFWALLINIIVFEILFGFILPMDPMIFGVYSFFLIGMGGIFMFIGYLVENISRKNYIFSAKLKDSLAEVQTLSGLLPICSHCKKIRDDKGYWQQVEIYIGEHTDAQFSHSMCPNCIKTLYSKEDWCEETIKLQEKQIK